MDIKLFEKNGNWFVSYYFNDEKIVKDTKQSATKENKEFLINKVIPKLKDDILLNQIKFFSFYSKRFLNSKKHIRTFGELSDRVNYLLKTFANYDVTKFIPSDVESYFNLMLENVSPRTVKKYLQPFRSIIQIAIKDEIIKSDPTRFYTLPKHYKKEIEIFSPGEVNLILQNAQPLWFRNYLAIGFYTGMRTGEIIGLKIEDIKFNFIQVKRDIRRGIIGNPKTENSKRDVPIFDVLKPFLQSQLELASEINSEFLFFNPNDNNQYFKDTEYMRGNNKEGRWVRLLNSLDLKYRVLYSMRHTFITTMIKNGFSLPVIAQIVGHSSIEQITKTYSKFIQNEHLNIKKSFNIYL